MKFVIYVRAKWRRFLLSRRNRKILIQWAVEVANDLTRYEIEVQDTSQIEEALDRLESKVSTEQAARHMGDLFSGPGPFQRRLELAGGEDVAG